MTAEQYVQLGPYSLFFRRAGAGPAVVLLHGIPTHSLLWHGVIPTLAGQCSVFAPDLLGYGSSDRGPVRDLTLERQADHVLGLMDALGVAQAHLVGHDIGGGIAQILAVARPQRVLSLCLIDSVCFSNFPIPEVAAMRWPVVPEFEPSPALVDRLLVRGMVNPAALPPHVRQALLAAVAGPGGPEDVRRAATALEHHVTEALVPHLANLRLPATILWGDHDRFLPPYWARRLQETIPGSVMRLLPGCGHFSMLDNPALVAGELLSHLQRAAATRLAASPA